MAKKTPDPTREVPRGGHARVNQGTKPRHPAKDVTIRRRELVEKWWIEGMNLADIRSRLLQDTNENWSRQTIWKDLCGIRERWEKEGGKRSREQVRMELERMARRVFSESMTRKKTATRREQDKNGKVVTTTVLLPDPDLASANRAIERIAALHGLNVTTLDGTLNMKGLTDLLGEAAEGLDDE